MALPKARDPFAYSATRRKQQKAASRASGLVEDADWLLRPGIYGLLDLA